MTLVKPAGFIGYAVILSGPSHDELLVASAALSADEESEELMFTLCARYMDGAADTEDKVQLKGRATDMQLEHQDHMFWILQVTFPEGLRHQMNARPSDTTVTLLYRADMQRGSVGS